MQTKYIMGNVKMVKIYPVQFACVTLSRLRDRRELDRLRIRLVKIISFEIRLKTSM